VNDAAAVTEALAVAVTTGVAEAHVVVEKVGEKELVTLIVLDTVTEPVAPAGSDGEADIECVSELVMDAVPHALTVTVPEAQLEGVVDGESDAVRLLVGVADCVFAAVSENVPVTVAVDDATGVALVPFHAVGLTDWLEEPQALPENVGDTDVLCVALPATVTLTVPVLHAVYDADTVFVTDVV
jgi:hypothetical protein